ncbi:26751_t:CDS:1, partial [Gigaspora margarita]
SIKLKEDYVNKLIYNFADQNTDLFIEQDFEKFLKINNKYISMNRKLNDEQIVKIILAN